MSVDVDLLSQSAVEFAVPLWLAGLGELVVQRSGVVNIGIEGMMLCGALAGWAVTVATGSAWAGLAAAAGAGMLLAVVFAVATLVFDADQVVTGTAVNLLAFGATGVGFKLAVEAGLTVREAGFFDRWELFGSLAALNQYGLFYATLLLAAVLQLVVSGTRWGIELSALGEYPAAAESAGICVRRRRAACLLFGGLTAGIAGSYLSIMFTHEFGTQMTAGRGFLALALVIFGRWQPTGLLAGGLFFGYVYAVGNQLEVTPSRWLPAPQVLQMAPYVLSLIVLAGAAGRSRAPAALGKALERQ